MISSNPNALGVYRDAIKVDANRVITVDDSRDGKWRRLHPANVRATAVDGEAESAFQDACIVGREKRWFVVMRDQKKISFRWKSLV